MSFREAGPVGVLALALLTGCGAPYRGDVPAPVPRPSAEEEARALLLYLSDRQVHEPFTVELILDKHPDLQVDLALAVARVGDPRAAGLLHTLLASPRVEVRRAAAFGLGLLGDPSSTVSLLAAAAGSDRETGRLAVEALARLETPLRRLTDLFEELPVEEFEARLLPSLFRFGAEELLAVGRRGLESDDREARRWSAYALSRKASPGGVAELRLLLSEARPWVRGWAARALGNVGDASDLDRLLPLLDDAVAGPVIQALRAARNLLSAGRAAAPGAWLAPLERLLSDPRPGVRISALEAAGAWPGEPRLGAILAGRADSGRGREREVALLALVENGDPRALELTGRAALDRSPSLRVAAAAAAASLGAEDVLRRLAQDPVAGVRLAVLSERLSDDGGGAGESARRGLEDQDEAVRATALDWLAANPVVGMQELTLSVSGFDGGRLLDLPLGLVRALAARAVEDPLERGAIVATLEVLARDPELLVRRAAAEALEELGRPKPAIGAGETGRELRHYRGQVARSDRPRWVDLVTRHGSVRLRLECPSARLTCLNFLQLANQGFYDGLTFHRVVPDFVVQGGDPRGDGWGGPGYTLRDENNLRRFERGVIGMALSGPHTAGSQFFITLSPQPHLDGTFTAFGRVVGGDAVLDQIVQGDRIERMVEVENP